MAGPEDVLNYEQGVSQNGDPLWFNVVRGRADVTFGSLIADPLKGQWNEPLPNGLKAIPGPSGSTLPAEGVWDHGAHDVLAAEAVSWRYVDSLGQRVDLQSILIAAWEYLLAKDPAGAAAAIAAAKQSRAK
jgi:hypothetical protein